MIINHTNGNCYIITELKMFVSAINPTTNSIITVELSTDNLNAWEEKQYNKYKEYPHIEGSYCKCDMCSLLMSDEYCKYENDKLKEETLLNSQQEDVFFFNTLKEE